MQEAADWELLRQYVHRDSNEAFAALLTRHVNMVYSVALRKTGNPQAAEEITQAVFIILAKKARGLSKKIVVSGWLYHAARLTAVNFLRAEIRRARREQEAYMQSFAVETEPEVWRQITPLLEDGMARLGEKDRDALVLRFFEGKSFQEIARAAGATENAAKKRVHYALEKLRRYFAERGVVSSASALAGAIATHSVQAAPIALVQSITAATIAKGVVVSGSTLALVKATLKTLLWAKLKSAAGLGAGLLAAGAAVALAVVETNDLSAGRSSQRVFAFEAEGILEVETRAPGEVDRRTNYFRAVVSNCNWLIRVTGELPGAYREVSHDGTNVYCLVTRESAAGQTAGRPGRSADATITAGRVPLIIGSPSAGVIWLALCSACALEQAPNSLAPVYKTDIMPVLCPPQKLRIMMSDAPPTLPLRIEFQDDGVDPDYKRKRDPPWDIGFTAAKFEAVDWTNVAGLLIPSRFALQEYVPDQANVTPPRLSVAYQFTGRLTGARHLADAPLVLPELTCLTTIADRRLGDQAEQVVYHSDRWLSIAEVKKTPEYQLTIRGNQATATAPSAPRGRGLILALMATITLFLVAVLLRREMSSTRRKQQT